MKKLIPKLVVSIAIGALFAWLAKRGGVPLWPPRQAFSHVTWWAVPGYLGMVSLTHLVRATRWRFLIEPIRKLPLGEVITLNWIGFFAIFTLPLRLGEFVRPALTRMRYRIPMSAGLGTVAVERVIDGVITSCLVAWALFALPTRPTDDPIARAVPVYGSISLAVFVSALLFLGLFLWQKRLAAKLIERTVGLASPRLAGRLAEQIHHVADGLRCLGNARLAYGFALETAVYWFINIAGMWVLAIGCGLPLSPGHIVAVTGILSLGILLPTGPGLFGNFQLALVTALRLYLPDNIVMEQGSVYIFLLYLLQAGVVLSTGIACLLWTHTSIGRLMPSDDSLPAPPLPQPVAEGQAVGRAES